MILGLEDSELSQLSDGLSVRSSSFGKQSQMWYPTIKGWPDITNSNQATSGVLQILFRFLPTAETIEHLSIHGFNRVQNLDFIQYLPNLKSISAAFCESLIDIQGLSGHKKLEKVSLLGSPVVDLSPLREMHRLLSLSLGFSGVSDNECKMLTGLPKLVELDINNEKNLTSLDFICHLPKLIFLTVSDCNAVTNLDGFRDLPKLRKVLLTGCSQLQNVDGLSSCFSDIVHCCSVMLFCCFIIA